MEWLYGVLAEIGLKRLWAWCRNMRSMARKIDELEVENRALKKMLADQYPEIRLTDTITYREQPDGSRVVTETKLVKPVNLKADLRAKGAGSATLKRPPAATDDERP